MKTLLAFVFGLVVSTQAQAQAPTLSDYMKEMKALSKQIVADLSDASKKEATAQAANDLRSAILNAVPLVPDSMTSDTSLSAELKHRKHLQYQRILLKLPALTIDLEEQILDGEIVKAQTTLKAIGDIQKEGHKLFNP